MNLTVEEKSTTFLRSGGNYFLIFSILSQITRGMRGFLHDFKACKKSRFIHMLKKIHTTLSMFAVLDHFNLLVINYSINLNYSIEVRTTRSFRCNRSFQIMITSNYLIIVRVVQYIE